MTKLLKKRQRTKRIHINQHNIKANRKSTATSVKALKDLKPVITAKTYKENAYGHEVMIEGPCKVIYRPNDPLSCGAHVWIETQSEVVVFQAGEGVVANL